jgi:Protein of unknown function (DUF2892)
MHRNVGILDPVAGAVLGFAAIANPFRNGLDEGLSLIRFVGLYPLATALFLYCPLYGVLGLSSFGRLDRST